MLRLIHFLSGNRGALISSPSKITDFDFVGETVVEIFTLTELH